jgi:hypothetical protein
LLEASYKLDAETVHIGAVKDLTNEVRWEVYHQDKWMQRLTPAWVVTLGDPIGCCRRATEGELREGKSGGGYDEMAGPEGGRREERGDSQEDHSEVEEYTSRHRSSTSPQVGKS